MNLDTLISSDAVFQNNDIKSKKRALEILAEKLASETNKINRISPKGSIASESKADKSKTDGSKTDRSKTKKSITNNTETHDENVDALQIFQLLIEREKLGSTGMGHGVAIPHARTSLIEHATAAFLKLENGIDFDSPDDKKTDLIFALMVPEHYTDEHLKILSYLATIFSNEDFCQQLRNKENNQEIYQQLISSPPA